MSDQMNRLSEQKSLYLKQHQDNPVRWLPWGEEAIKLAKKENKPVFISIGYSSCHWCHVMAEESFSDEKTAELLNEQFICIKVDREEHPDIDSYYQRVAQEFSNHGGWPLNIFLNSDFVPAFVGTYFPLEDREKFPSFKTVIKQVAQEIKTNKNKTLERGQEVLQKVQDNPKPEHKVQFEGHFPAAPSIIFALKEYQDDTHGGYGKAPKFPLFSYFEWAVEHILEGVVPEDHGKHIIFSLEKMMMGGIFDQARGGIHRYSTDEKWAVPHFEKMLYDQSGLLRVLSKVSLVYPSPLFIDHIILTLDYLKNELLSEDGYFFSAQDADSEGVEGLYFSFSLEEFEDALNNFDESQSDHFKQLESWFNITKEGNFQRGLNTITLNFDQRKEIFEPENWEKIRKVRQSLVEERKHRIPPSTDPKGVASWNFMMISALCDVIQFTKIEVIHKEAQELLKKCLEGIHQNFLSQSSDGKTKIRHCTTLETSDDFFEDYVFFAEAHSRLYAITGDPQFRENAFQTLNFVHQEFFKDNVFYTKKTSISHQNDTPNVHYPFYDQSYRSAVMTYLGLFRHWLPITNDTKRWEEYQTLFEDLKHFSLYNPLSYGEGLRTLVYPDIAYKKLQIPRSWLKNDKFLKIMPHFSNRFAFDYQDQGEDWQVCHQTACELSGNGVDEFFSKITGQDQEENEVD